MNTSAEHILQKIKNDNIKFVDFRFSDVNGSMHHITKKTESVSKKILEQGVFFDSSSIPNLKPIENSDMILIPDLSTYHVDAFTAQQTCVLICDIIDPETNVNYESDPRGIAKRAISFLLESKIADEAFFGPEIEFFLFDKADFSSSHVKLEAQEIHDPEMGYAIEKKKGYMPLHPIDSLHDIRSEILTALAEVGIESTIHHHEVASAQCEVGFKYSDLLGSADNVQKAKNIIRNVAFSYGKTTTFMPKPIRGDNGNGMHCHQSLWKNGKNLFVNADGSMSELCKYYIGGVLKHSKAINAIANPTLNSYKRLSPGYEAPTVISYAVKNRSACIRIPSVHGNNDFRIEARFPDMTCNSYMCFTALLLAGLDGIINKIDPGNPLDINLYKTDIKAHSLDSMSTSLEEALENLDKDREFLKRGGVFTDTIIDNYLELRKRELQVINEYISPIEFVHYYNR